MQPIYTLPESLQAFQTALVFPDVFRPRAQESHKGTYGTLTIIGGATGMSGAGDSFGSYSRHISRMRQGLGGFQPSHAAFCHHSRTP